jgi:hypothetical protein
MKVFREVQKKDGTRVNEWADAMKGIYSLFILTATFRVIVNRYLDDVSSFDDPSDRLKTLDKATETTEVNGRKYKGFNFFSKEEQKILLTVASGEFTIKERTNKLLRHTMSKTSGKYHDYSNASAVMD